MGPAGGSAQPKSSTSISAMEIMMTGGSRLLMTPTAKERSPPVAISQNY